MRISSLAIVLAIAIASGQAAAACPPADMTRAGLKDLKDAKWAVEDDDARNKLALGLMDCLSDPDPLLRDDYAFEGLQFWMRNDKLDTATVQKLRSALLAQLKGPDPKGVARPFAALVLAEVARIDRLKPFLSTAERNDLVRAASDYLTGVRDYRGFDEKDGWRHGVAHGADLLLQLAANPAMDRAAHIAMLTAIGSQVPAPKEGHVYIYGEGGRLAGPVIQMARRDLISAAEWEVWIISVADRALVGRPTTQPMLAHVHNLKGFLQPLYIRISEGKDQNLRANLLPIVTRVLKEYD